MVKCMFDCVIQVMKKVKQRYSYISYRGPSLRSASLLPVDEFFTFEFPMLIPHLLCHHDSLSFWLVLDL